MNISTAHPLVAGLELGPEFLATKIAPPHVPHRGLARARLLARIGVPPARRLTLVYAPAGFGKSSFLAAWTRELSASGIRPAWLSVDSHDVDLHHFLGYVAAALNAAEPAIGSDVIELVGRRGRSIQPTLLVHLLLDSISAQNAPVVLVIDDYHAAAGSAIDEALSELVLHAPPNLHLVIAGRGAPPLRLGRLRAAEQLLELGPDDLAFDSDEVRSFFVQTSGCDISAQEVAQLQAFSEGWPACLQMAAISMRRRQSVARVLHAPRSPGREIASYLREDVLQGIEPELRSFLMRTALLERFNSALAGAVAGVTNARALIEALERRQLFLVPLDDRGEWFRYHPLFGNCLREELAREHAAAIPALHLRACDWLAGNELWGEAVRHATASGHPERALAIVEGCAMDFVRRGDFLTLTELLRSFPEETWQQSIGLQTAYAWALAYGSSTREATNILARVETRMPALAPAEQRAVATQLLLIRLTIILFEDDTERCRALLEAVDPALPDQDTFASDIVNTAAAFVHVCAGHYQEAREYLPCLYPMKRVYQQIVIALSWLREGRPVDAEREIARAQELALGEFGERSISNLLCQAALAPLQYERGEFAIIERGLGSRLPMLDEVAPTDLLVMGYAAVAWARAASGMFAEAESLLVHLQTMSAARRLLRAEAWALLELLRLRVARGTHAFDDLASRMREIAASALPSQTSTRWEAIACARLGAATCHALGSVDSRALDVLSDIVKEIDETAGVTLAVRGHLLLAHAFAIRGEEARAQAAVAATLARARPAGMLRTVRESGAWARDAAPLPESAAGESPAHMHAVPREHASVTRAHASVANVELSAREQEVLGLVSRGFSNKAIGKTLKIAPETVKWHIKNLFAKLGVANRMQAVNRARDRAPH